MSVGDLASVLMLAMAGYFLSRWVGVVAFPRRDVHLDASAPLKVQTHGNGRETPAS